MVQPVTNKNESTMLAAFKSLHGPNEDISKLTIRTDNANELKAAIETDSFADPTIPHRPNSNRAEQSILTFSDLLRVRFFEIRIGAVLSADVSDSICSVMESDSYCQKA